MEEVAGDEKTYQELRQKFTEYQLIVDSSEQRGERLVDYEEQKKYYSGKNKMHAAKNSVYCYAVYVNILSM